MNMFKMDRKILVHRPTMMIGDVSLSLSQHVQAMNVAASTIKILTMDYTVFIHPANTHTHTAVDSESKRKSVVNMVKRLVFQLYFSTFRLNDETSFRVFRLCVWRVTTATFAKIVYFLHLYMCNETTKILRCRCLWIRVESMRLSVCVCLHEVLMCNHCTS